MPTPTQNFGSTNSIVPGGTSVNPFQPAPTTTIGGTQNTAPTTTTTSTGTATTQPTTQAVPMGDGTTQGYVAQMPMPVTQALQTPVQATTDLAAQHGTQSTTPSQVSDLTTKYQELYKKVQDYAAAPSTNPMRSPDMVQMANQSAPTVQEDATKTFIDNYAGMDPMTRQIYDYYNSIFSTPIVHQSLAEELAKLTGDPNLAAGIPGESLSQEQTKLMNLKNVMEGTEDDLRAEIQNSGGFATESQVLALAGARNKVLLKQANVLLDSMALKQDYVDQIMKYTQLDRAEVERQVDRKLGIGEKIVEMQDKLNNAAQENWASILRTAGFAGLHALVASNPAAQAQAEKALGLPLGSLTNEAFLATQASEDQKLQFISGTANQASGYFDPKTGKFTSYGGGGGGTGGTGTGTGGTGAGSPLLSQVVNTIKNSLANPTKAQLAQIDQIQNSSNPFAAIKNQAQNIMGQTRATNLLAQETAQSTLTSLSETLKQFYAKGGSTNIFSGNLEYAVNKLGEVKDPKLVELATQIESTLQIYRNAISGTAYSNQEGQAIAQIFPGINKTEGLNTAILAGRQAAFTPLIAGAYDAVLGQGVYSQLQQQYQPTAPTTSTTATTTVPKSVTDLQAIMAMIKEGYSAQKALEYVQSH